MRIMWLGRLAAGVAALAMLACASPTGAQERFKIEIVPQIPHSEGVTSVAFSADGARVLSGSTDKTLKLWDAATGALLRTFEGHSDWVSSVAISPDGAHVLSGSQDKTIKLLDAATGRLVRTFEGHDGRIQSVAFSPDGTRVLAGSWDRTLRLWDAATGQLIRTFEGHTDVVWSVAFSPDGTRALSGSVDQTLKLWDVASGQLINTFEGHAVWVRSVAFSPDGSRLLSGSGVSDGKDNTLKLWDAATGRLIHTLEGHFGPVYSVAFSPDGARLLSGSADKTIKMWDAASGALLSTFDGHSASVLSVAFSPDGTRVLSGGLDTPLAHPKLWDAATGALLRTFEENSAVVHTVAISPDGSRMLSGSWGGTVKLWDLATGAPLRTFDGHSGLVTSVAISSDGIRVLSGSTDANLDHTIKLWDATTGALLRTFEGHSNFVMSVAFSPDGTRVLSGSLDKTLKLWDAATGALLRTFEGHSDLVMSVAFSPDGTRVLSGSGDDTLKLWDASSGALVRTLDGHSAGLHSVAFSPDGARVLSGSAKKSVKLWDAATGALLRIFEGGSPVAFSADGTRVLYASADEKTVKLRDTTTGALLRTFEGHSGPVTSVAFSPDGTRVVSGSADGTIGIWDTATGARLASFFGGRDGEWLVMTPAGFFAASRKGTEMLSVVRGLERYSVMQFYDHLHRPDLVEEVLKRPISDPEGKHKDAARRVNLQHILDSGPAPHIKLLPDRTDKGGEKIKLAVRIADEGGGIGKNVIWRVNGKTKGDTTAPGLGGPASLGRYVVMEQMLTVDPSKANEIEIIAYNADGLLATAPLQFKVDAWGVAEKEWPRLFVLAIGVDKYLKQDWQLRYAAKDARAFAEELKVVGSARIEGRPLFADIDVKTLTDAEVTERNIAAEFARLANSVKDRDVFVLFLGGHGRSIAGEGWFYIPQDLDLAKGHTIEKNAIGPGQLRDWLAKVPADKSLIVLDACEADAFRSGDRVHEMVIAQLQHGTGRNTIAAAPAGKAAYEGYKEHGVLTYAILEALHRPEGAVADPVSVFGIAAHISLKVPAISQATFGIRQQPRFTPTGDDFSLGLRTAVLKDTPPLIPTTPTHVNLVRLNVYKQAGGKGGVVLQLQPITSVTVITTERGWAHIAREGKALGYVREGQLKKLN